MPSPAVVSAAPARKNLRRDIQGLRAVAVILVVAYHAGVPLVRGGYVGVDVFFVISGFLITTQLANEVERTGRISLGRFYARRARRLLPPAALVVVSTLVFGWFVLPLERLTSLAGDAMYAAVYGLNYHLALEGVDYQTATEPASPLQHFWSLAVEEQFYVIWPLLVLGCAVLFGRRRRAALVCTVLALTVASLTLSVATTGDGPMAYFGLHTRAWELGAGALLALTASYAAAVPLAARTLLAWVGLAAIALSAVVYSDHTPFPGVAALLPVLGAVAVIAAGAGGHQPKNALLDHGAMQYTGRTSYAWYLWHWPMLLLLPVWWGRELTLWENVEVALIAYWFAVLTYFLENASQRSPWRSPRWLLTGAALSGLMMLVSGIAATFLPNVAGDGDVVRATVLRSGDLDAVTSAVTRSLSLEKVPANLTPKLDEVDESYPLIGDKACFADIEGTSSPQCEYGAQDWTHTAALVGDSHAEQWLNALETAAADRGWRIVMYAKAACGVQERPIYIPELDREYTECSAFQAERDRQLAQLDPDLFIFSQADSVSGLTDPQQWADDTMAAVRKLTGGTTPAVYIGDSPYTGKVGSGECLERNLDDVRSCIYPRDREDLPNVNADYALIKELMLTNGVRYVDTRELFCSGPVCPPIVDNMLTHRDNGHVTRQYAQWLAPVFAPIFEDGES